MYIQCSTHHTLCTLYIHNRKGGWEGEIEGEREGREKGRRREGGRERARQQYLKYNIHNCLTGAYVCVHVCTMYMYTHSPITDH